MVIYHTPFFSEDVDEVDEASFLTPLFLSFQVKNISFVFREKEDDKKIIYDTEMGRIRGNVNLKTETTSLEKEESFLLLACISKKCVFEC
ncbi:hypothetical protein CEXT_794431 [Caerostris extrusa]|uniref:Uncharacterized protein n=1 Tax=Caerostris extrusa TaxID=172846 RepID=A0AAV4VI93_CAEEX|nr:hypothetical protein CEXT_794431 [Caerostris extrusa]